MRAVLLLCSFSLLCTGDLAAQLSLDYGTGGEVAGAMISLKKPSEVVGGLPFNRLGSRGGAAPFSPARQSITPRPFDFTRTAPHLAFFCRLEINEAAGHVIPLKFRLGGHQHWQDNLLRE